MIVDNPKSIYETSSITLLTDNTEMADLGGWRSTIPQQKNLRLLFFNILKSILDA